MSTGSSILMFTVGAAVGSAVTWFLVKKKYERIAQEEIDSVIQKFAGDIPTKREEAPKKDHEGMTPETVAAIKQDRATYTTTLKEQNYTDYADPDFFQDTQMIEGYEVGELEGYDVRVFTYYADDVLADDDEYEIENVGAVIDPTVLEKFNDPNVDAIYIRNHRLKNDYEILRSLKTYAEVLEEQPYKAED